MNTVDHADDLSRETMWATVDGGKQIATVAGGALECVSMPGSQRHKDDTPNEGRFVNRDEIDASFDAGSSSLDRLLSCVEFVEVEQKERFAADEFVVSLPRCRFFCEVADADPCISGTRLASDTACESMVLKSYAQLPAQSTFETQSGFCDIGCKEFSDSDQKTTVDCDTCACLTDPPLDVSVPEPLQVGSMLNFSAQAKESALLDLHRQGEAEVPQLLACPLPGGCLNPDDSPRLAELSKDAEAFDHQQTALMICSLPGDFSRDTLAALLNSVGFAGCFDFVYCPTNLSTGLGIGYAFVNFISFVHTQRAWTQFHGNIMRYNGKLHVLEIHWAKSDSEVISGLADLIEKFRDDPIMNTRVPDAYKPAIFLGSRRVAFPKHKQ